MFMYVLNRKLGKILNLPNLDGIQNNTKTNENEEEIIQKVGIQFRMTELILLEGEILIGIKNN